MPHVGVVIPAHNEEFAIRRALSGLSAVSGIAEVAVVCNGCSDSTAAVAAEVAPWAKVIELDEPSKPAALRAGDAALSAMPRLYLDADVALTADAVHRLAAVLEDCALMAAAPTPRYDTSNASLVVRSHYRIWTALYDAIPAVYGTGAIMLSAAGRSRFDEWPDVIADDFFVDGLFAPGEKCRVADVEVVVALPRRWGDCVSRKARVHQGKLDIERAGLRHHADRSGGRGRSLLRLLRAQPALIVDVPAHLAVTLAARAVSAWRRRRGSARTFYRDTSTRSA